MRERLINRRQQGDLGEISAIEWLTRQGATVSLPIGHSPDYDLIAEVDGELARVQVKTSVLTVETPNGHARWSVRVATNGGNQSWTGIVKRFDPSRDGLPVRPRRRWPALVHPVVGARGDHALQLGGPKYSEFEIDRGSGIESLVYGARRRL